MPNCQNTNSFRILNKINRSNMTFTSIPYSCELQKLSRVCRLFGLIIAAIVRWFFFSIQFCKQFSQKIMPLRNRNGHSFFIFIFNVPLKPQRQMFIQVSLNLVFETLLTAASPGIFAAEENLTRSKSVFRGRKHFKT